MFNDIKSAINTIITSSQRHALASQEGDYKTANKNYDLMQKAVNFLRTNNGNDKLMELLKHEDVNVRVAAASFLLKHSEKQAIDVLEATTAMSIPNTSFNAKMVLQEWRNGNLNL